MVLKDYIKRLKEFPDNLHVQVYEVKDESSGKLEINAYFSFQPLEQSSTKRDEKEGQNTDASGW